MNRTLPYLLIVLAGCAAQSAPVPTPLPAEGEIAAELPSGIVDVARAAYEAMVKYPGNLKEMRVVTETGNAEHPTLIDRRAVGIEEIYAADRIVLSGLLGDFSVNHIGEREVRVTLRRLAPEKTGLFMRAGLDAKAQPIYNVIRRNLGYEDWQVY
jgi:hypothetical protein